LALAFAGCAKAQGAVDAGAAVVAKAPEPEAPVTDVTAKNYKMPALPMGHLRLKDAFGGEHVVEVEIAATSKARTRGLMWREHLDEGKGMIFLFPAEEQLNFWMKNTLIPLDMVFIGKDRKIVGIVENAEPQTLTSRYVPGMSQYVLEVPGGWSATVGLKAGLPVEMNGLGTVAVTDE